MDNSGEILKKVEDALDSIRPFLKQDGGDVELVNVDADMQVSLRLLGACGSCEMSAMTLRAGIEDAIKKAIPDVKSVHAVP
ncbi:MAG: Fe/S biogenesis protein NfuA [Bacteroidetes bacterium MED-G17]|nr:MAG: Fe/S biogenesis protein NfuA [Bacteroidetes bacterium MED-G17]|tara:strand:- start:145 stop:387 length:243 start_codon:yes stop_codon:yes gene_type:complete